VNIQRTIVLQLSYTLMCCCDINGPSFVYLLLHMILNVFFLFICSYVGKLIEYFLVMTYFILQIFIAFLNVTFFCLYGLVRIFCLLCPKSILLRPILEINL